MNELKELIEQIENEESPAQQIRLLARLNQEVASVIVDTLNITADCVEGEDEIGDDE